MNDRLIRMFSTFFYAGFLPFAPGTFASVLGVGLAYILQPFMAVNLVALAVLLRLGFLTSGKMEGLMNQKDPGCVVIDEVCGVMIAFLNLPFVPAVVWTAFFLFRAFDMFKISPADKFEAQGGAFGIMMDDVVAGVYTNIIMHAAIRVVGIVV